MKKSTRKSVEPVSVLGERFKAKGFRRRIKSSCSTQFLLLHLNTTKNISKQLADEIREEIDRRRTAPAFNSIELVKRETTEIIMPVGKYKGYDLGVIPTAYLAWLTDSVGWITSIFRNRVKAVIQKRTGFRPEGNWPPKGYKTFRTPKWLTDRHPEIPRKLCEWRLEDAPC